MTATKKFISIPPDSHLPVSTFDKTARPSAMTMNYSYNKTTYTRVRNDKKLATVGINATLP